MTDFGTSGRRGETPEELDPLRDAHILQVRIRALRALLDLQRWQVEVLADRLYSTKPGGVAARRLLFLKQTKIVSRHADPGARPVLKR